VPITTIAEWLETLGLAQYTSLFDQNRIGPDVVPDLTERDLRDLGIPLGDRKRLLKSIHALAGNQAVPAPGGRAPEAERRQLTVMFCDLVGSTELSQRLDPEELRRLIRRYQDACVGAITRVDGFVAQYLGDGVLAYFGYPVALEAGAERAIRAALAVVDRVGEVSLPNEQTLRVRIGIDTGLVVIGQGDALSEQERTAVGDAPNIAARLQALAAPNTVAVSARTRQLAGDSFHYQDLGAHSLKGVADPVRVWQVTGERAAETRFDAASGGIAAPMVGRQAELDAALRAWQQVKQGKLRLLLLCGEPGIGKSRIMRALRDLAAADGAQVWQYQCSPYFVNSALYPILAYIERILRFERDEPAESRLAKLEAMVKGRFGRPDADVNLLGRLFGLPVEARFGPLAMSPQKQKDETLRALNDLVRAAGETAPVLMLYEDVHWADPTTIEAIDHSLRRPDTRALVVLTYRPEFKPPWLGQPNVTALSLGRLDPEQTEAVATRVAGGKALPSEIVAQIVAKTDGVPLFVEELTKTILESSVIRDAGDRYALTGPLPAVAIPSSLRDSLMARLDRLASLKEVAQIGACIGREFSDELLALVSPLPRAELDKALVQLVAGELVFKRGAGNDAVYVFKHALVQDAAYDSLLKSKRVELHVRIARALEERFPHTAAAEPELLAHHYTEAGKSDQAVPYWLRAGQHAFARTAITEAIADLDMGLAQVAQLSEPLRDILELELRTLVGTAWMALGGWFHPKVQEHLEVAWPIARTLQRYDLMASILWGLAMHAATQGRSKESLRWVEEALRTAEQVKDRDVGVVAHMIALVCLFWYGDLLGAKRHVDWVLDRYDPIAHERIAQLTNHDPKTLALIYEVQLLWALGSPDRARDASVALDQQAESRGHYFDQGFAWTLGGWAYLYRGDAEEQGRFLDKAYRVGIDQGLPFFSHVQVPFHRAYNSALLGKHDEAVEACVQSCGVWRSLGGGVALPHSMAYWAEAEGRAGRPAEGLKIINEALDQINRPGWEERAHLAEVLRVQGWLFQELGQPARAEESLVASLAWAREQQAKGWQLRTAISLARLWQSQGKRREVLELLQPIYQAFTEGFDTRDMKEAKRVLDDVA